MGRPKAKNVKRDSTTGRSRGPVNRVEEIMSVALNNRVRRVGLAALKSDPRTGSTWADERSGYSLGILNIWGHVSEEQLSAGKAYADLVARYCSLRGLSLPTPKSASLAFVGAGRGCRAEPDDETVNRVRRQHSDARRALLDAGMSIGVGSRVNAITYEVCIEDRAAESLSEFDIGNLRVGLNALGRIK